MIYYQEFMDAGERVTAYFASISSFRYWCLKNTKHQETARIVDVVTDCEKAYFPVHTPTKPGPCYEVVTFASLQGKRKILSTPSFGGEVKPSVPCRRFAACKRSLNLSGSRNLGKITWHISRPQLHLSLLGSLASLRTYRHLAVKVGTSKGGRKQWQTTPKNLPGCSVTWLGSVSCQPGL